MKVAHQLRQITDHRATRSLFSDRGAKTRPLSLLEAIYFDRTTEAHEIIDSDPGQINKGDPYAGLTPLHLSIFRQQVSIVIALANHPMADLHAVDCFGRKPIDMCAYTRNALIFNLAAAKSFSLASALL